MTWEKWVPVAGYGGRYKVSDRGRVRGPSGKILRPGRVYSKTGRLEVLRVMLSSPRRYAAVHILVLEGFVGPRPPDKEGAHGDGDPEHNHVGNLRWATHQENISDRALHGTTAHGDRQGLAKLKEDDVRFIRASKLSRAALASRFSVTVHNIGFIIRRETWKHVEEDAAHG